MRLAVTVFVASALLLGAALGVAIAVDADEEEPFDDRPTVAVSVDALIDTPQLWFRKPIRVTGRAVPVDEEHFVLQGGRASIVVQPQPATVDGTVERGERVTVTGILTGFGRVQVHELRRLLQTGRHPALAAAPHELEDVFITADDVDARG